MNDEKCATISFSTDVWPEVTLGQYKGLEAERLPVEITDEEIEADVERMRKQNSRMVTVDRPAENGDTVNIDYKGTKDGTAFQGGSAENFNLVLGSGNFIPGFEEKLIGVSAGEERDLDLTFPENYHAEELAGQAVVFHVKCNEVKFQELPALDDEFAKDNDFDTLEELRADIRKRLTERKESASRDTFTDALVEKAAENMTVEMPKGLIEERMDGIINDYAQYLGQQGIGLEDYMKMMGTDVASFRETTRATAERQARTEVLLTAVADAENLEVTEDDLQAEYKKMAEAYNEFAEASNLKSFLLKNSDRPLSDYWYKDGELSSISSDVNAFAFGKASGVSPIFSEDNSFFAAKVTDTAMLPDSVYVKHILLQGENARNTADSLAGVIRKGGNFASAAAVYSADQGSAADGELGNIGWMTQSYMIPGFESVITAEIGKPYVIDTQYGSHVVLVSKKTRPVLKKKVAILEKTALASKETFNEYYAKANRFATLAGGTYEGYKKAVDSLGVYSHPMNNVREGNARYGTVEQAKEVTRWIYDAKKGKASNIITVNNNFFFVAALKDIHEEGYAPVKEVAPSIRQMLYSKKIGGKKAAEVAEKIAGLTDLQAIAEALGTTVSSHSDLAFSSMGNPGLDPAFIGAVAAAEPEKICGPVAGSIGVYVFKVTGRDTGAFFTEDDAKNYENQKMQYSSQMIIPVMMEEADVVDHRDRFF